MTERQVRRAVVERLGRHALDAGDAGDVGVVSEQVERIRLLMIEVATQRLEEAGLGKRIADRHVPRAQLRFPAERRERIRRRAVGMPVVNRDVQVRRAAAPTGTAASAATAAAPASALAALRHGAERLHETHVDVVELRRRGRDRMEVLLRTGLIRQRVECQQRRALKDPVGSQESDCRGTACPSSDRSPCREPTDRQRVQLRSAPSNRRRTDCQNDCPCSS